MTDPESDYYLSVYVSLVILTGLTVASFYIGLGRLFAITLALAIASVKAALIGLYFMHLRHESRLIHGIVLIGIAAVVLLAIGILPDVALRF